MLWVFVLRWHGLIVSRGTYLDMRNSQRWIRGFRHSAVQKRCSEGIPVPWLALRFQKSGREGLRILGVNILPLVRPRGLSALRHVDELMSSRSRPKGSRQVIRRRKLRERVVYVKYRFSWEQLWSWEAAWPSFLVRP